MIGLNKSAVAKFHHEELAATQLEYGVMIGLFVAVVAVIVGPFQEVIFGSWTDTSDSLTDALNSSGANGVPTRGYDRIGAVTSDF